MKLKEIIFKILQGSLAVLSVLILIIAFGFVEKNYKNVNPRYGWQNENYAEKYKDVVWKKITNKRLDGFTSNGNVATEEKIACFWSNEPCRSLISKNDEYLRVEGGIANIYYFLTITKNGESQTIKSFENLKKIFAPVDNEIEAMSFIGATERDLKSSEDGVLIGETAVIDDGFLVKVVKNNTFGCGQHDPQKVIFKITKAGEITEVANEILPPPSKYDYGTCVD